MVVAFEAWPLPNQSGAHRLVFNAPVLNSSSRTMVAGAPALAGAVGRAPLLDATGVGVVAVVVVTVVVVVGGAGTVGWVMALTGVAGCTVTVVTVVVTVVTVGFTLVRVTVVTVVVGVGWVTTVLEGAVTCSRCTPPARLCPAAFEEEVTGSARARVRVERGRGRERPELGRRVQGLPVGGPGVLPTEPDEESGRDHGGHPERGGRR